MPLNSLKPIILDTGVIRFRSLILGMHIGMSSTVHAWLLEGDQRFLKVPSGSLRECVILNFFKIFIQELHV